MSYAILYRVSRKVATHVKYLSGCDKIAIFVRDINENKN